MEKIVDHHLVRRNAELLDFGCGNMPYRPLFEPKLRAYLAFDLPGNEMADGIISEDGKLQRDDESVDIVLSSQVLEHVSSPDTYLAEAYRVLKPGGQLILSTHGVWCYHPDPADFWRWTCDGLKKLITAYDFNVTHFEGLMGPEATAIQLWQDARLARTPGFLKRPFTWTMQRLMERADRRCQTPDRDHDACVYVVVAARGDAVTRASLPDQSQ